MANPLATGMGFVFGRLLYRRPFYSDLVLKFSCTAALEAASASTLLLCETGLVGGNCGGDRGPRGLLDITDF